MSRRLHRALTVGSICLVAVITPASATAQHAAPLFREWSAVEASGWQAAQFTQLGAQPSHVGSPHAASDSTASLGRIFGYSAGFSVLSQFGGLILFHFSYQGIGACRANQDICWLGAAALSVLVPARAAHRVGASFLEGVAGSAIGTGVTWTMMGGKRGHPLGGLIAIPIGSLTSGLATTLLHYAARQSPD